MPENLPAATDKLFAFKLQADCEKPQISPRAFCCNRLSACYDYVVIPKTACESFNLFLDRSLIVGDLAGEDLAFFEIKR
jgi:hypothetical protein